MKLKNKMVVTLIQGLTLALLIAIQPAQASGSRHAFEQKTLDSALGALGAGNAVVDERILINAPTLAEIGSVVPIEVVSKIPGTESISLLVEKNPFPLAARINLQNGAKAYVRANLRLAAHSNVHVVVKAGKQYYRYSVPIKVTIGGCGGGSSNSATPVEWKPNAGENTRIRARLGNNETNVRVIIRHPMETGQRKNSKTGKPIPAHYINSVIAKHNDRVVYRGEWSASISQNPGFSFRAPEGKQGDKISISWTDNLGMKGGNTDYVK